MFGLISGASGRLPDLAADEEPPTSQATVAMHGAEQERDADAVAAGTA